MSLTDSIKIAKTGINTALEGYKMASLNITNLQTPGYSKREVNLVSLSPVSDLGGVTIKNISRATDKYWAAEVRDQTTNTSYYQALNETLEKIQILHGKPIDGDSLDNRMADLISSLKDLSTSPATPSIIRKAVFSGKMVAEKISSLAQALQEQRFEIEQKLSKSFEKINNNLKIIEKLNDSISHYLTEDETFAQYEENREILIKEIAEELDITVQERADKTMMIFTSENKVLLVDRASSISYDPISYVEEFIKNYDFNPAYLIFYDNHGNGEIVNQLITGGKAGQITSDMKSGRIKAFIELRDEILPNLIDQLDLLASRFSEEFNNIHNMGTNYPGLQSVQSERLTSLNDFRLYQGNFRIAITDANGDPVNYPADQTGYIRPCFPLDLNLSSLNEGKGQGVASTSTIINEINEHFYYEPLESRVALGDIENIKIAATDNFNIVPDGVFNFNFEVSNKAQNDASFNILNITIYNNLNNLVPAIVTLPANYSYNVQAGDKIRTPGNITVDFGPGAGTGPYIIRAEVRVINNDGTIYDSEIDYIINDNPLPVNTPIMNKRYPAKDATNQAIYNPPITTQNFAKAMLVDAEGNEITQDNIGGYLLIKTQENNYYLSFDADTSQEYGRPTQYTPNYMLSIAATHRSFSHYMGLNNFFVENANIESSALNMQVRSDILANPSLMTRGKIERSPPTIKNVKTGENAATGEIYFIANPNINDTITINGQLFTFKTLASSSSEITIGANLSSTLTNIVNTLSAINSYNLGSVSRANYLSDNMNKLLITYINKGAGGNQFTLAANMVNGASINNGVLASNVTGNLIGGTDLYIMQGVTPWTYQIGEGSNKMAELFANFSSTEYDFIAYGGLPVDRISFTGYCSNIISYNASKANEANIVMNQNTEYLDMATNQLEKISGVDKEEEMYKVIMLKHYWNSCAKVMKTAFEMMEVLLSI